MTTTAKPGEDAVVAVYSDDEDGDRYTAGLVALTAVLEDLGDSGADPREWFVHRSLGAFPGPGLLIPHIGYVGLPLSNRGAREIVDRHGYIQYQGSTVCSLSMADGDFELRNPRWHPMITGIIEKVKAALGIPLGMAVTATPSRLVLLGEDDNVGWTRVQREAPGMFAKLMIMLPNRGRGGTLTVASPFGCGTEEELDLEHLNSFNLQYAAYYVDCVHRLSGVTSGYRCFLTYNLITTSTPPPKPLETALSYATLKSELSEFFGSAVFKRAKYPKDRLGDAYLEKYGDEPQPVKLVHILERKYEEQGLSFGLLEGKDVVLMSALSRYCDEQGGQFALYLGNVKHVSSELDDDECRTMVSVTLQNPLIKAGEGSPYFFGEVDVDMGSEVVPMGYFDDESECDYAKSDNDGIMHYTTTRAALIVIPIKDELRLLARLPIDACVPRLASLACTRTDYAAIFAKELFSRLHKWSSESAFFGTSLAVILQLNDLELFVQLVKSLPSITFNRQLIQAMHKFGTLACAPPLTAHGATLGLRGRINLARMLAFGQNGLPYLQKLVDMVCAPMPSSARTAQSYDRRIWRQAAVPADDRPTVAEFEGLLTIGWRISSSSVKACLRVDASLTEIVIPGFVAFAKTWPRLPDALLATVEELTTRIDDKLEGLKKTRITDLPGLNVACCKDCATLNSFLRGPLVETTFRVGKLRRKHIHQVLEHVVHSRVRHETDADGILRLEKITADNGSTARMTLESLRRQLQGLVHTPSAPVVLRVGYLRASFA